VIYKSCQSPFQSRSPLTPAIMPSLVLETNVKVADYDSAWDVAFLTTERPQVTDIRSFVLNFSKVEYICLLGLDLWSQAHSRPLRKRWGSQRNTFLSRTDTMNTLHSLGHLIPHSCS